MPKKKSPILETPKKAPLFESVNQDGDPISSADFKGKWMVLYFYPKDMTPGCTTEGKDFESLKGQFADRDTVILGVSKDSVARHRKFCDKEGFTFALVSDESGRICEDFGVWQEKKNFGKTYMGIVRSTFIIDPDLNIRAEWTKVKVAGHAQAVFDTLEELQS